MIAFVALITIHSWVLQEALHIGQRGGVSARVGEVKAWGSAYHWRSCGVAFTIADVWHIQAKAPPNDQLKTLPFYFAMFWVPSKLFRSFLCKSEMLKLPALYNLWYVLRTAFACFRRWCIGTAAFSFHWRNTSPQLRESEPLLSATWAYLTVCLLYLGTKGSLGWTRAHRLMKLLLELVHSQRYRRKEGSRCGTCFLKTQCK